MLRPGLVLGCLLTASCDEPEKIPPNDNPETQLRAALDQTLPQLYGWEENANFVALLVSGAMVAGECELSKRYMGLLLSNNTPDLLRYYGAKQFGEALKQASGGFWTDVADVCYGDVAEFTLDNIGHIPAASSSEAEPVLQSIAYNFRLMGMDAKAEEVVGRIRDLPRTNFSGTSLQGGVVDAWMNQVDAYRKLEQPEKAVAILTRMASGELDGYSDLSDRDAEKIAKELVRFDAFDEAIELVLNWGRSRWVEQFAGNYASAFLERATPEQAIAILSFVDPKNRSDRLLPTYFERGMAKAPTKMRPYADQMLGWIFDPLKRAEAQANLGGWLGTSDRDYAQDLCGQTRAAIREARQDRDRGDEAKVLGAVRAYGACWYGIDGRAGLGRARDQMTNIQFRNAVITGAINMAMVQGDWAAVTALGADLVSRSERQYVWQTISNRLPIMGDKAPDKQSLPFFKAQLAREMDDTSKRHLTRIIETASGEKDHGFKWVKKKTEPNNQQEKEILDGLDEAGALIEAGDVADGRRQLRAMADRVLVTESPVWISRVAFYMAHTGQWDMAVALAGKIASPVKRAYALAFMYRILAGHDGSDMALEIKLPGGLF